MAEFHVATDEQGIHGITLTPGQITTITFADDLDTVEILNMDGAAEIYFTVNDAPPEVAGRHCRVIPAGITSLTIEPTTSDPTQVQLISAGAPKVSVARA